LSGTETTSAPHYTIAVCKGSALVEETKALLRTWEPGESLIDFQKRVLHDDVLGRATAYRVKDIVRRVFARRLLLPDSEPAVRLKRLAAAGKAQIVSDLLLLYAARQDDTLRDVIVDVYWPAVREGQLSIAPQQVIAFLREAEARGRMAEPWSEQVRIKVARGLLGALIGFGMMRQFAGRRRETVSFQPSDGAVLYLAHDLHFAGLTDAAVVAHRDWRLYGFREDEVRVSLDTLMSLGWGVIQAAGSVVRISWTYTTMQEVVDALAQ
jgi:hypothetical protein